MDMTGAIHVDRKDGTPLYLQVKRQIEQRIRLGTWPKGTRLPTERELARELGLSRNTVSSAYRELEIEGVITSRQGRGTFVSETDRLLQRDGTRERLMKAIDACLEETLSLGFSIDEFLSMAESRAREKKELFRRVKVAFVECNREQLDFFSRQLELGAGVSIMPILLDHVRSNTESARDRLSQADVIVTTFFHLDEVKSLIADRAAHVFGIALDPQLDTIVRIARIGKGKRAVLVCLSEVFADRVRKSIELAGIDDLTIDTVVTRDRESLAQALRGADAFIVSPGRKKEVEALVPRGSEVIEFVYRPDAGSINLLRSVIIEAKRRPEAAE
ncbi:MAG: GntR family transcriptional regulator [Firmicutes bacterium]|jgi:GntR family transcriptional regulator|nr:GntR family transcriptional regulator [Bacillota bacterium]